MEKTLNHLRPGESGVVARVTLGGAVRRRLYDMGVTPGVGIVMRKVAPLGDPMEVAVRGYELSLRKNEASGVLMRVESAS